MCPEVFVGCGCTSTNILQYILFLRDGDFSCDATRLGEVWTFSKIATALLLEPEFESRKSRPTSVDDRNLLPVLNIAEN